MPISLTNLTQILVFKLKMVTLQHRKKLIFALVLFAVGYLAKKKLTLAHVLSFVQGVTRIVQALPLPESPVLRRIAEYEHPNTVPLKAILEATKLDEIKRKISRREAGWEDLKQAITTSTVLSMVLYNANSISFLVQNKYSEEFIALQASTQFDQAMSLQRKRFLDEIPALFESVRGMLFAEFQRIQLGQVYDVEELIEMFQRMVQRVLEGRFDIRQEGGYSKVGKVCPEARNLFTSSYEYIPSKGTGVSLLGKVGTGVLKVMGGLISFSGWFPEAKVDVSAERYLLAKGAYLQPLKKAINELQLPKSNFEWPNKQSSQLFTLVTEEIQFFMTSLNFSTLLKAYSQYNLKILYNRLNLFLQLKKRSGIKFSELLPSLYKIVQEEFLKSNQMEFRDRYHSGELKKALRIVESEGVEQMQSEVKTSQEHVLEEIQMKEAFKFLERELELKVYNERSGMVIQPKAAGGQKDSEEMKRLLTLMSSSEGLTAPQ